MSCVQQSQRNTLGAAAELDRRSFTLNVVHDRHTTCDTAAELLAKCVKITKDRVTVRGGQNRVGASVNLQPVFLECGQRECTQVIA